MGDFKPATIPSVGQIRNISDQERTNILQYISDFNDLVLRSPGGQPAVVGEGLVVVGQSRSAIQLSVQQQEVARRFFENLFVVLLLIVFNY